MRHGSKPYWPALAAAVFTGFIITAALTTAPLSALANPTAPTVPAAPADQPIRIGLGWSLTNAEAASTAGLLVVADGKVQLDLPGGKPALFKLIQGKIVVDGLATPLPSPVRLVPKPGGQVLYKSKPYRGELEAIATSAGRLSVANLVNLEEYLLGVVPNEMPSGWPAEALKAQAVAARTYAIANRGKQKAHGFDLMGTEADQAYGGIKAEAPSTSEAVRATRGQVLTYGGRVISTYYHSSSGGHTENNEDIWTGGTPVAYLRGVEDYDDLPGNDWFTWSYSFTGAEFTQKLKQSGYSLGEIKAVTAGAPGAGSRPTQWSLEGSTGKATLTMQDLRSALGLPAPARSVKLQSDGSTAVITPPPAPLAAPVYAIGSGGSVTARQVAGSYIVSAGGAVTQRQGGPAVALGNGIAVVVGNPPPAAQTPPPPEPKATSFQVAGGGRGHGVGLSQWGAKGMALRGDSYTEILTHFYTGTKVETR